MGWSNGGSGGGGGGGGNVQTFFQATGLSGATVPSRYVGGVSGGAPTSGTFQVGDFVSDNTGGFWICDVAGSPGTWNEPNDAQIATINTTLTSLQSQITAFGSPIQPTAAGQILNSTAANTWGSPSGALSLAGLTGTTAASRYVGGTTGGAPGSGTFAVGDLFIDQLGLTWVCTVAGSPGTWNPGTALGYDVWPAVSPDLVNLGTGGSQFIGQTSATFTPAFYEIQPPSPLFAVTNLGVTVSASAAASTIGLAIYSIAYSSSQTFAATRVCQINSSGAVAGTATGMASGAVTTGANNSGAAVATLNFATTKYIVGVMASDVSTTLKARGTTGSAQYNGLGILRWSAAARSSAIDWPASFTQTSVAACNTNTNITMVWMITANGLFRF